MTMHMTMHMKLDSVISHDIAPQYSRCIIYTGTVLCSSFAKTPDAGVGLERDVG